MDPDDTQRVGNPEEKVKARLRSKKSRSELDTKFGLESEPATESHDGSQRDPGLIVPVPKIRHTDAFILDRSLQALTSSTVEKVKSHPISPRLVKTAPDNVNRAKKGKDTVELSLEEERYRTPDDMEPRKGLVNDISLDDLLDDADAEDEKWA